MSSRNPSTLWSSDPACLDRSPAAATTLDRLRDQGGPLISDADRHDGHEAKMTAMAAIDATLRATAMHERTPRPRADSIGLWPGVLSSGTSSIGRTKARSIAEKY